MNAAAPPPHVLVHGSPGGPATWRAVCEALGPDVRWSTPSLAGHRSAGDLPEAGLDIAARAADVVAACLEAGDPVVLVGHSFGGVVALAAALARPDLVARLVLVEPVLVAALDGHDAALAAEVRATLAGYVEAVPNEPAAIATMIDLWFGAGTYAAMPDRARAGLAARSAANGRDVRATLDHAIDRDALGALRVPTTLLVGTASPPAAREIGVALAALLPDAALHEVVGGAHDLHERHPDAVVAACRGELGPPAATAP